MKTKGGRFPLKTLYFPDPIYSMGFHTFPHPLKTRKIRNGTYKKRKTCYTKNPKYNLHPYTTEDNKMENNEENTTTNDNLLRLKTGYSQHTSPLFHDFFCCFLVNLQITSSEKNKYYFVKLVLFLQKLLDSCQRYLTSLFNRIPISTSTYRRKRYSF